MRRRHKLVIVLVCRATSSGVDGVVARPVPQVLALPTTRCRAVLRGLKCSDVLAPAQRSPFRQLSNRARTAARCRRSAAAPLHTAWARGSSLRHRPQGVRHRPQGVRHRPQGVRHRPQGVRQRPQARATATQAVSDLSRGTLRVAAPQSRPSQPGASAAGLVGAASPGAPTPSQSRWRGAMARTQPLAAPRRRPG